MPFRVWTNGIRTSEGLLSSNPLVDDDERMELFQIWILPWQLRIFRFITGLSPPSFGVSPSDRCEIFYTASKHGACVKESVTSTVLLQCQWCCKLSAISVGCTLFMNHFLQESDVCSLIWLVLTGLQRTEEARELKQGAYVIEPYSFKLVHQTAIPV